MLHSCGSDEDTGKLSADQNTPTEKEFARIPADTRVLDLLPGRWIIVEMDGQDLRNNDNYKGIRHDFLMDGTWILSDVVSSGDSSVTGIGGGKWSYDSQAGILTTINLPDSTITEAMVTHADERKMIISSKETGREFVWERIR